MRPRVEKEGTHGLFSQDDKPISLSKAAKEVAEHKGLVWTTIMSLRREDAELLKNNGKDTPYLFGKQHTDNVQFILDGLRDTIKLFIKVIFLFVGIGAAKHDSFFQLPTILSYRPFSYL